MDNELRDRIIKHLEWMTTDMKLRFDAIKGNTDPEPWDDYSDELKDAMDLLEMLKRESSSPQTPDHVMREDLTDTERNALLILESLKTNHFSRVRSYANEILKITRKYHVRVV